MFQNLRRVLLSRSILLVLIVILGIFACRCTPQSALYCDLRNETAEAESACNERFATECPDSLFDDALFACFEAFQFYEPETVEPSGTMPAPNQQMNAIVSPTDCSVFRLTAPLDGLPNGTTTFYWDPVPEATGYQISVYDGGTHLASWNAPAGATNLVADVSANAIGGGFSLVVQATAFTGGMPCFSQAGVGRAASANNNTDNSGAVQPEQPAQPPAEPTVCSTNDCIR